METKIRLRFSKKDTLRFIGHLDFMRVFMQAIRRSGLPIAYSQGFNPHQLVSFALPLPLGMESVNDYVDITLSAELPGDEIASRINNCAPQGLRISAAYKATGQNSAAATIAADYAIATSIPQEKIKESVKKILESETLVIPKKTKSGIKNTDIRPDIFNIQILDGRLLLRLSAGSARFLNSLLVAEQVMGEVPCTSDISRLELYQTDGKGGFVPL
ncbi:MAG: TIGR03936 family radical SAM-associated protein [Firmicutes bacterium]|nr:TIGR03936 family radical SAM-associated protein [Bacillota bacterium]